MRKPLRLLTTYLERQCLRHGTKTVQHRDSASPAPFAAAQTRAALHVNPIASQNSSSRCPLCPLLAQVPIVVLAPQPAPTPEEPFFSEPPPFWHPSVVTPPQAIAVPSAPPLPPELLQPNAPFWARTLSNTGADKQAAAAASAAVAVDAAAAPPSAPLPPATAVAASNGSKYPVV